MVVLSDAAALDEPERRRRASWVTQLASASWLHPRPRELWSDGARWLHGHLRVNTLAHDELLRIGPATKALPLRTRWQSPELLDETPQAACTAWRFALGDEAYRALAGGAVLSVARCLNATTFWMLVADNLAGGPWSRLERIWNLPGIRISASGEIGLPAGVALALSRELAASEPKRAWSVARWLQRALERAGLGGRESLAGAQAQVQLARVYAATGMRAEEAHLVRDLKTEGLTELFSPQLAPTERSRWRVRARLKKPSTPRLAAGAALLLLGVASAVALRGRTVLECAQPGPMTFAFTDKDHPRYAPGATVTVTSTSRQHSVRCKCPSIPTPAFLSPHNPRAAGPAPRHRLLPRRKSYAVAVGLSHNYLSTPVSIQVGRAPPPPPEGLLTVFFDTTDSAES